MNHKVNAEPSAPLTCDVCGGSLVLEDASCARCSGCGIEYSVDALRSKLGIAASGDARPPTANQVATARDAAPLLRRARLMCEDADFKKAARLVDEALNLDPESAEAYVVALMADHRCRAESELGAVPTDSLGNSAHFKKARRFGSAELNARLDGYVERARQLSRLSSAPAYLRMIRWDGSRPLTSSEEGSLRQVARAHEERDEQEQRKDEEKRRRESRGTELRNRAKETLTWWDDDLADVALGWSVIHVDEEIDRVLVIADRCVVSMPYMEWGSPDDPNGFVTWVASRPRSWLNSEFYPALPDPIRSRVLPIDHRLAYVKDPKRVQYDSIPNPDPSPVIDHVFLLDAAELEHLTVSQWNKSSRQARMAAGGDPVGWWLRSDSHKYRWRHELPHAVGPDGTMVARDVSRRNEDKARWEYGADPKRSLGLRPAFWLDVSQDPIGSPAPEASNLLAEARRWCQQRHFDNHLNLASHAGLNNGRAWVDLALAVNPEDADAYVVAAMVDYECRVEDDMGALVVTSFRENRNFQRAKRFGDAELVDRLEAYARRVEGNVSALPERQFLARRVEDELNSDREEDQLQARLAGLQRDHAQRAQEKAEVERSLESVQAEEPELRSRRESLGVFATRAKRDLDGRLADLLTRKRQLLAGIEEVDEELTQIAAHIADTESSLDLHRSRSPKWSIRFIDESSGRALAVAASCVADRAFHSDSVPVTWAESDLRRWLSDEFEAHLPSAIRARIRKVTNHTSDNGSVEGGEDVDDRVFLLSIEQAVATSNVDGERIGTIETSGRSWWLRSPGSWPGRASRYVDGRRRGGSEVVGVDATFGDVAKAQGVRPAMWVSIREAE